MKEEQRAQALDDRRNQALAMQRIASRHTIVESARFLNQDRGSQIIQIRLSSISSLTQDKEYYTQNLLLQGEQDDIHVTQAPQEAASKEVKLTTTSANGIWTVNFRDMRIAKSSKRIIEVLRRDTGIYVEVDVTEHHAAFLGGDEWGEPAWLGDEEILVYVADQHPAHWHDEDKPYSFHEYAPTFGEQLNNTTRPGLFLLDFRKSPIVARIEVVSAGCSKPLDVMVFKQPTLLPWTSLDDPIVVFATGCSLLPDGRRPGSIWCDNQPYAIFRLDLSYETAGKVFKASATQISPSHRSARFPRLLRCEDSQILTYTSYRRGYEHNSCAALHKVEVTSGKGNEMKDQVLADIVRDCKRPSDFPGLYPDFVPKGYCLRVTAIGEASEKVYLVLPSLWASRTTTVTVDVSDGSVVDHGTDEMTSFLPLATDGHTRVLAIKSSIIHPPELLLGVLHFSNLSKNKPSIKWQVIESFSALSPALKHSSPNVERLKLYSTIVRLPSRQGTEALVVTGRDLTGLAGLESKVYQNEVSLPAQKLGNGIVWAVHGGPGKQDSSTWNLKNSLSWVAAGYAVAFVNYPGSAGLGQSTIEDLTKDCGNIDVQACLEMKRYLVDLGIASNAKGKSFFLGHSHSGFIGAHLSVRFPGDFDGISLCNPVIDLVSNFATSDIPAWSKTQFGLPYSFDSPPTYLEDEEYGVLKKQSVSHFANQLLARDQRLCVPPTQLIIGSEDLRLPPNQGINWYHYLKGHGQKVSMFVFPDNGHCLEQIWASQKAFQAQLDFVLELSNFDETK